MYDGGKIIAGIVIFLILVTSPIWYDIASGKSAEAPELQMPKGETSCVMEKEYMRSNHMDLLNVWRDDVVRDADRVHISHDGTKYNKSLSKTCLGCHDTQAEFCDKCHDYAGVAPYCWECHVDPKGVK